MTDPILSSKAEEIAKIAALEKALQFYADYDNYHQGLWVSSLVQKDSGVLARAILNRFPTPAPDATLDP